MKIVSGKMKYLVFILVAVSSCLEPYELNIKNSENLLVVDGLVTDEIKNHRIILTRSISKLGQTPPKESGALVIISDNMGNEEVLTEVEPGVYETDWRQFKAEVGNTYVLSIQTAVGDKYKSTACTIQPKSIIKNIYFAAGKDWSEDQSVEFDGIKILLDGNAEDVGYVRWLYEEDWKFRVPYPTQVEYNYESLRWQYISPVNVTCWKTSHSNNINIHSCKNQEVEDFFDKQVCFVPTLTSDKLTIRYSVLVKQLSISEEEYVFWERLKATSEHAGDLFGKQPYSIVGNVNCVSNENEPVLGYFQTGSVVSERIFIDREEIEKLNLPIMGFTDGCQLNNFYLKDYDYGNALDMYKSLVLNGSFALYDAIYEQGSIEPAGLMLSSPRCSDCTKTGSNIKPKFWED